MDGYIVLRKNGYN